MLLIFLATVSFLNLWCTATAGICPAFSRTSPPAGSYLCPGDRLNYTCTVNDISSTVTTVWTGTAFQQCGSVSQQIAGQIGLSQRTLAGLTPMTPGVCGNLTAVTTYVNVSCYTSVLTVTSPQYVNGTTIACLGVGNDTLNVLMACPPSPPTIAPISCTSSSVTINWTKPFECGSPVAQYILTTNPPSQNCNTTCSQSPDLRQATISVQPNRTTTISVRADNCGGSQAGQTSSSSYLIQVSGMPQYFKGVPVFNVSSQGIIRIDFSWTPVPLQLSPGGLSCGQLQDYTISINTQTSVSVQCTSNPCTYPWSVQNPVAITSYNASLTGLSLSAVGIQIAATNNVLNTTVSDANKMAVVTCTFLPGLVGTSGCVVSFGTSPNYLPYTSTSSQSGGSGQSISVQLTINGAPLAPNVMYYYAAMATSGSLVTVVGSFQTANYSVDCTPQALGGQASSGSSMCPTGQSTLLISNGYICYGPSLGLGTVATQYCNQGYQVIGTSLRSCQWTGYWDGAPIRCDLTTLPPQSGSAVVGGVVGGVLGIVVLVAIILIAVLVIWRFGPGRLWNVNAEPIVHVKVHRKDKRMDDDYLGGTLERGSGSDLSGQKRSPRMSPKTRPFNATPTHDPPGPQLDPASGQQLAPTLSLTSQSIPPGKRSTIALQPKRASKVIQSTNSLTFVDISKEGPGAEEAFQKETQS